MRSSRVYCPCIPGAEMSEIRISLASPLLALHGGWEAGMMNNHTPIMDTQNPPTCTSRKRNRPDDDSDTDDQNTADWSVVWPRFIVLEPRDILQPLTKLSPFAVEKAILGRYGTVKKVRKMRTGGLLVEASRATQARMILDSTSFMGIEISASPHRSLNTCKGVIRDYGKDLYEMSEDEMVKELADQGVEKVSRFILRKEDREIKTNTYFVTFATSSPPEKLRIGYYFVEVKPYIPNPLRCFQCQEFGHSKKFCKKSLRCWKCGKEGHDGNDCSAENKCCVNCKGDHYSSSKTCPVWILEKEIQKVKTEKNLPYGEAKRLVSPPSSSPATSSYASAARSIPKRNIECQTPDFWINDKTSLLELSRRPSVQTATTGSSTETLSAKTNTSIKNIRQSKESTTTKQPHHKISSPSAKERTSKESVESTNKYQSLQSDVDDEMDDSPPPDRPSRSSSRSRRDNRKISPVHYR